MDQLAIDWQASCSHYRSMGTHWISRLTHALAKLFSSQAQASTSLTDHTDRDAERMRRELELIRLHFPQHS